MTTTLMWKDTPTRKIKVGGVDFAYRELGTGSGVPVVFLHHLTAVLDDWDPRIIDGIAAHHRVIAFDNRGIGGTGSSVPGTVEQMGNHAWYDTGSTFVLHGDEEADLVHTAMRYLRHLVAQGDLGQPYHFRSCRLQDWGTRNLGWRQQKRLAGTGELGDMLSHRIDFAHQLVGPIRRMVANVMNLTPIRDGAPNDTDDWVAILAEFENGASGVLESSKLASGRNESWRSLDYVEINGSEASFEFTTGRWNELLHGRKGGPGLAKLEVPREFWVWPGSPRDPGVGDPLVTFRYDQAVEFINAIREQRSCSVTFHDGARAQAVMDGAVRSAETREWIQIS